MCTLIVLHRRIPDAPLVVGANRDEFFERPAEGPALWRTGHGVIVAPRDVRAGGTWLGLNAHGLFAAITNRPTSDPDRTRRSRGLLVTDALGFRSAAQAAERLTELPAEAYNPFNLLVADREEVHVVTYDGKVRWVPQASGVIVIGNADPTQPPTPKLEKLIGRAERAAGSDSSSVLDELAAICRGHDGDGDALQDVCVHAGPYGTRSSTLLRLGGTEDDSAGDTQDPRTWELRYTDEPPCTSDYRDYTPLLRELVASSSSEGNSTRRNIS